MGSVSFRDWSHISAETSTSYFLLLNISTQTGLAQSFLCPPILEVTSPLMRASEVQHGPENSLEYQRGKPEEIACTISIKC